MKLLVTIIIIGIALFTISCLSNHKVKTIDDDTGIICTDQSCEGLYFGPEFIDGSDVAHQFSNSMSRVVGDHLKSMYDSGSYLQVDLNNILMTTDGMGSGTVSYTLVVPFLKVANKCDAYTSFDHVGGWNHTPELDQRISQLNGLLLANENLNISNLNTTKEGLQEYWIQWKHREKQSDCK